MMRASNPWAIRRPAFALAAAVLLTACGSSAPTSSASGAPLTVDIAAAPGTIDPAQACGEHDVDFISQLYSRLTQYGSTPGPSGTTEFDPAHIVPWLAKSWTISNDGLVYTFHLHPNAKFDNGDPLDAAAVKYSLERSVNTGGCGSYFVEDGIYGPPPLVGAIDTPDASTVVVHLSQPDANFLQDLNQPGSAIVDSKIVEANGGVVNGKVNTWMQGHVAGSSGPYVLQQYTPGVSAVLAANPNYFDPPPATKKITVNFIPSDSTLLLRARSGAADVTLGMSPQSAHTLVGNACCKVVADPTTRSLQVLMPSTSAPLDNVNFRAALTYAVPYQEILSQIAYGYGELFYGPYPPLMKPQYNAATEQPRTNDLARARSLLAQSGVKTPVNLTMITNGAVPLDNQVATILQASWQQIGVNITINTLATATFETTINSIQSHPKAYQLAITQDGPGVIDAGYYLAYDMLCGSAFNAAGICVPGADKLLNQARVTVDGAQRLALYRQIIPLWTAASPKIPVIAYDEVTVLSSKMKNYFYSGETAMWTWSS